MLNFFGGEGGVQPYNTMLDELSGPFLRMTLFERLLENNYLGQRRGKLAHVLLVTASEPSLPANLSPC